MPYRSRLLVTPGLALAILAIITIAVPTSVDAQGRRGGRGGQGDGGGGEAAAKGEEKSKIKPYDEVITDKAETKVGLFYVHLLDGDVYYEIPLGAIDKDMLWVTSIAGTTSGSSYAGMPAQDLVVRWEKRNDDILLRRVTYRIRAETDDPISIAVEATNIAPIMKKYAILAYGKDQRPVIKVTDLFTSNVAEFSAARTLGAGNIDGKRSFIEQVKAFERNIETRVLATYAQGSSGGSAGPGGPPRRGGGGRPSRPSSGITARIHHSMVKLPDRPMTPRKHDSRVGFFSVGFTDFADDSEHEAKPVRYISRWRLEKKDPDAEMSDPVKPIVFYVGRGTPEKWKPFVKAGIEQWIPAFEAAGFSNAIAGRYAPDPHEDPDWDAEDARISTIRWLPADIKNAFGPHVHDPRTGEILESDVRMYHNAQKLVRDWYFVQASAVDERAQKLPMPDELMGELIQFVVAHEVGHSLGFPHNMKASSSYTVAQLRDKDWVKENGTAPSIMDYARFNYVTQPGDGAALMPGVGPYDKFAAEWGYRQFSDDADEKAELEKIAARQIDEPMFRFGGGGGVTAQSEDLSNNAVEATTLGLANLERIAGFIVEATSDEGEDYTLLDNMYNELWGQWSREMGHVTSVVGGVEQINLYYGDADQRYFMVDADYQRSAVAFLLENALATPDAMIPDDVLLRLTPNGAAERVLGAQSSILRRLITARTLDRMTEWGHLGGDNPYLPSELLQDLRDGVFAELGAAQPAIDFYRRNLQRSYIDLLANAIQTPAANSDLPALVRVELVAIRELISDRADCDGNTMTTAHLADLTARINAALDPRAR